MESASLAVKGDLQYSSSFLAPPLHVGRPLHLDAERHASVGRPPRPAVRACLPPPEEGVERVEARPPRGDVVVLLEGGRGEALVPFPLLVRGAHARAVEAGHPEELEDGLDVAVVVHRPGELYVAGVARAGAGGPHAGDAKVSPIHRSHDGVHEGPCRGEASVVEHRVRHLDHGHACDLLCGEEPETEPLRSDRLLIRERVTEHPSGPTSPLSFHTPRPF